MSKVWLVLTLVCFVFSSGMALADDKATPKDVYDLVIKAHEVIKALGDDGLVAFNDPKGEFVYKDTYVFVQKCPDQVVAHPFVLDQLKGRDLRKDYPFIELICEGAKNPNGTWVEYQWPKPGETNPSRKVTFVVAVEGTPYQVVAGIYNDEITLEELNASLK